MPRINGYRCNKDYIDSNEISAEGVWNRACKKIFGPEGFSIVFSENLFLFSHFKNLMSLSTPGL